MTGVPRQHLVRRKQTRIANDWKPAQQKSTAPFRPGAPSHIRGEDHCARFALGIVHALPSRSHDHVVIFRLGCVTTKQAEVGRGMMWFGAEEPVQISVLAAGPDD